MICIGSSARIGPIPHPHQLIQERKHQNRTLSRSSSESNLLWSTNRRSTVTAAAFEMEPSAKSAIIASSSSSSPSPSSSSSSSSQPLILASGIGGMVTVQFLIRALRNLLLIFNSFLLLLLMPFRRRSVTSSERDRGKVVRRAVGKESEAAARRALATRRLREFEEEGDVSEGETERSCREFCLLTTARGDTLFTQSWTPAAAVKTKGLVVLMHGLNEHSGRYNHFAKQLNASGFKVYAMDWIGHGGSDGLHGYVHSLDYAVDDLKAFLEKVVAENPGLPCFFFGHSTGAAIVLKTALDPKIESRISGVVLTSPAIRVQASHPFVAVVAPIFSILAPTYQFSAANKKGPPVSRDPEALKAKYSDPLVFTGAIRVRTGYEILRISYYLQQNLNQVTFPFLVLHGTADTVTDPIGSQKLYEEASSTDKSIKLYDGYFHDLLFEPERDDISKEIIDWLTARLDAQ